MKHLIRIFCLLLAVLLFAGCAASDRNIQDETDTETESAASSSIAETSDAATTAVSEAQEPAASLPDSVPPEYIFTSGAGAWRTFLKLNRDGTFSGEYSDSDMGDASEEYPNGTVYLCEFQGTFENIQKVNEYTYTMTLKELKMRDPLGKEWIEDGIRYVASDASGIAGGTEFKVFFPQTPLDEVPEEFLTWWPGRYTQSETPVSTLSTYGILNCTTGEGFFQ